MSKLHVRHIRAALERLFTGHIDLSDVATREPEDLQRTFLSRALAAYALSLATDLDVTRAGAAVVDGYEDNGIDAVFYDQTDKTIYLVQSKWIESGNSSPERGDVQKFIKGFWDLIDARFERFNSKLAAKASDLQSALDDPQVTFTLILAYTGLPPISSHVESDLKDLLNEANDTSEIVSVRDYGQKQLHASVSTAAEGESINIDVTLSDWGHRSEPFPAFYGQLGAETLAKWWQTYGNRLFARNLRKFKERTDVNDGIADTLRGSPENFWYFNNGVTVLCNRIAKTPKGGPDRGTGSFSCEGISIVNGAQTVGTIATAYGTHPEQVTKAAVMVRFISLEDAPENWATDVTRAANTQNRISGRDFAALDPQQDRLRRELWLEGKQYAFKSGDPVPTPENGCTIDEASVALACAAPDIGLAVQAKREVGKLWEDTTKPPYTVLFSPGLTGTRLWRCVEVLRVVDSALKQAQSNLRGREYMVAVHGNRFVLYRVFRALPWDQFDDADLDMTSVRDNAETQTTAVIQQLIGAVQARFANSMLPSLFKNLTKCKQLSADLDAP